LGSQNGLQDCSPLPHREVTGRSYMAVCRDDLPPALSLEAKPMESVQSWTFPSFFIKGLCQVFFHYSNKKLTKTKHILQKKNM
jgi:hypothetical protein